MIVTNLSVVMIHSWLTITSCGFLQEMEGKDHRSPFGDLENGISISRSIKIDRAYALGYNGGNLSTKESDELFRRAIDQEVQWLDRHLDASWKNNQWVAVALISMSYNSHRLVGPNVREYVRMGDYDRLSKEMAYGWNIYKAKPNTRNGLIRRRFAEANLIRRVCGYKLLPVPSSTEQFITAKQQWVK